VEKARNRELQKLDAASTAGTNTDGNSYTKRIARRNMQRHCSGPDGTPACGILM